MLRLEDFMEIQKLHHDGWSVTEIARQQDNAGVPEGLHRDLKSQEKITAH
jgi:IS30 family transposase